MFSDVSNFVHGVDSAFAIIIGISLFFLVAIMGLLIYIVIRFSKKKNPVAQQFTHNNKLEFIWTAIPLILVMLMFYYGYMGFSEMRKKPKDSYKIDAIGRMWEWEFVYPNGKKQKDTLVIPKNVAVELNLISEDVNHSFFIPAFRVKEDMVQGLTNFMWFEAYEEGDYDIFCTEYCGLEHSKMIGITRVVTQENFDAWLEALPEEEIGPEGLEVLKGNSCMACHSIDGANGVGPTFKGLFNSNRELEDGSTVVADEAYIKESIYNPNSQVVKGYGPVMQSYKNKISEEEVKQITEYLKSIGAK